MKILGGLFLALSFLASSAQAQNHSQKQNAYELWQEYEKQDAKEFKGSEDNREALEAMEILENVPERSFQLQTEKTRPFFILSGGFNSCPSTNPYSQGMMKQFLEVYKKVKSNCNCLPLWLLACQDLDSNPYVVTSQNKDLVQNLTEDQLAKRVTAMDKNAKPEEEFAGNTLFMMGHSHGGWRMMKLATLVQAQSQIGLLFTIDPISKRDCGISEGALSWLGFGGTACRRAPLEYRNVATQTKWVNAYQTGGFLHSGPINLKHVHNLNFGPYGHTRIDNSQAIWDFVSRWVDNF